MMALSTGSLSFVRENMKTAYRVAFLPSQFVNAAPIGGACLIIPRDDSAERQEGFEGVLTRKHSPNSARRRIFDGTAEAKLIALMCSPPPKGRAKWSLRLLEDKVVELNIGERASDNTIGRTLKKTI
jgi:Homeodomain-like domain